MEKKRKEKTTWGGGGISKNGMPIGAEVFSFFEMSYLHGLFRFVSVCAQYTKKSGHRVVFIFMCMIKTIVAMNFI
jgi:hypothetical protein